MIVECPGCMTIFPVDPNKVPDGGIHARCTVCNDVFFVTVSEPTPEEPQEPAVPGPGSAFAQEPDVFGEPMVTLDDEPIPGDEDFPPGEEFSAPEEETFVPVEDTPASAEETFVPADDEPAPAEETFVPADDEPVPAEETFVPVDDEPASEEETFVPVDDEPTSAEETFVPVDDEPASSEAAPSWLEAKAEPDEVETGLEPELTHPEEDAPLQEDVPEPSTGPSPSFGKRDPKDKAQRLARVLVSDIILYNPDRHQTATEAGRVKEEFEEEIAKSWTEYVEQVGDDVANSTPFFRDALNEILAKGEQVF